jgi:hypothetical protein
VYKDYIFDIEQLKFQKLQEMRQKLYLKKIGKLEDDATVIATTQMAMETQHTNYANLDKQRPPVLKHL